MLMKLPGLHNQIFTQILKQPSTLEDLEKVNPPHNITAKLTIKLELP